MGVHCKGVGSSTTKTALVTNDTTGQAGQWNPPFSLGRAPFVPWGSSILTPFPWHHFWHGAALHAELQGAHMRRVGRGDARGVHVPGCVKWVWMLQSSSFRCRESVSASCLVTRTLVELHKEGGGKAERHLYLTSQWLEDQLEM